MEFNDYINEGEFDDALWKVHTKLNKTVTVIPTGGFRATTKLGDAVTAERTYEEFQDLGGEPFEFYENLYDLMWKGLESESAQEVIDILKKMEKELEKRYIYPGCAHQAASPHSALSSHLGQIVNGAIIENISTRKGHDPDEVLGAYLKEIKEAYNAYLDMLETLLPLFGPSGRRLFSSLSNNDEKVAKVANCTVRATKLGKNTVRIEYDDFHTEFLVYCHPEIDEAMRMTRNELLDRKRQVKRAVQSVKQQIENML